MGTGLIYAVKKRLVSWIGPDLCERVGIEEMRAQLTGLQVKEAELAERLAQLTVQTSVAPERSWAGQATMQASSRVGPEGVIENFRGDSRHIKIGDHCYIRGRLLTYGHAGEIIIGDWTYIGARTEVWSMASVTIGNRVLISHNVNIIDGTSHSSIAEERHKHFRTILLSGHPTDPQEVPGIEGEPIVVEDDVWISFGVTILKGVRIGKGSIVAAGSIVTRDVPPNTLYRCKIEPIITPLSAGT